MNTVKHEKLIMGIDDYTERLIKGDTLKGYNQNDTYNFSNAVAGMDEDLSIIHGLRQLLLANTSEQSAKAAYLLKNLIYIKVNQSASSLYRSHEQDGWV